jgi:hypothetical protein
VTGVADRGKGLHVQEIRRAQVSVAVGVVGVDAGRLDDHVDRAEFHRVGHRQRAAELAKPAVDLGEAEVDCGGRHRGVRGINLSGPWGRQRRRANLGEHQAAQVDGTGVVDQTGTGLRVMPDCGGNHGGGTGAQSGHGEVTTVAHSGAARLGPGDVDDGDHSVRHRPSIAGDHRAGEYTGVGAWTGLQLEKSCVTRVTGIPGRRWVPGEGVQCGIFSALNYSRPERPLKPNVYRKDLEPHPHNGWTLH